MIKVIEHTHWSPQARKGLGETVRDDELPLSAQVNQGLAQLWQIHTDKGESWMLTRVELQGPHKELVVCCYKGCDVQAVTRVMDRCAQRQGFDSIRYHTQRPGLNRLVARLGFTPYETVFRKVFQEVQ